MDSLKSLDYQYFDVFLVDNGSEDDSINTIINYLKYDSFYSYDLIEKEDLFNYTKNDDSNLVFILNDKMSIFNM